MISAWPGVRLGEVLRTTTHEEPVDRSATYRLLGVRLDGQGPFLREAKAGSAISAARLAGVRTGDFIYSRLFAWRGAFGVIPHELGGCHVSAEFPTFEAVSGRIDLNFLAWWFHLPDTLRTVEAECSGSTPLTRNRLKEERFLDLKIPLPPLSEQRRIVNGIEELRRKVVSGGELARLSRLAAGALLPSALSHMQAGPGWKVTRIADCSTMSTGTTPPTARTEFFRGSLHWYTPGDLSFHRNLGASARTLSEAAVREGRARVFGPGTVLVVAIGASLGKVAMVSERCSANQQITGIKFSAEILPEYGYWCVRRLYGELRSAAPQATLPIINQRRIGELRVSFPPLPEQRRIVAYLDDLQAKVDALKTLQEKTGAELDALMPSILDKAFRGEL